VSCELTLQLSAASDGCSTSPRQKSWLMTCVWGYSHVVPPSLADMRIITSSKLPTCSNKMEK
jgi:hypothetical protein